MAVLSTRQTALVGVVIGLITSGSVLALLWFGVAGVLAAGRTDWMHLLWPSCVMLTVGWRHTVPGIMITVSSVAINCLMYVVIALGLRACGRLPRKPTM